MLGLLLVACSSSTTGGSTDFTLTAVQETVQLSPGTLQPVAFTATVHGGPGVGQTVSFAIVESGATGAEGATLAAASGVTDTAGRVAVGVRAGLAADFRLQATLGSATAEVTVIVESGTSADVLVAPYLTPTTTTAAAGLPIKVSFYDATTCAALDLDAPPDPVRGAVTLTVVGATALFQFVGTSVVNAAVGQVLSDDGVAIASGCVDIPGSSLLADATVQVSLPLTDNVPDPVGTYAVNTTLTFDPPLGAAATLAAPWNDLSDCPLDPAQLWLDCVTDALVTTATDPLDCVPSTAADGEGALGTALAALRGMPLLDGTGAPTGCRSATDAAGNPSLDAVVMGLFGSPTPPALVALPEIASDAAAILDDVQLTSELVVAPSNSAGTYTVTHTLEQAVFGSTLQTTVTTLSTLGLPALQAFTTASVSNGVLVIGPHGFTLHLGTVARAAFGPLSLVPRGLPADIGPFVTALVQLAATSSGATGCAALDQTACPAAGQPAGCLTTACAAGLTALTDLLSDAFSAADGPGLDLTLTGSAPLIDRGDGLADRLGSPGLTASPAAIWSVLLKTANGSTSLTATFEGMRE